MLSLSETWEKNWKTFLGLESKDDEEWITTSIVYLLNSPKSQMEGKKFMRVFFSFSISYNIAISWT